MILLPNDLIHPLFYPNDSLPSLEEAIYFKEEINFYLGTSTKQHTQKAWENKVLIIGKHEDCLEINLILREKFTLRRNKECREEMILALSYFLQFMFWTNGQPVSLHKQEFSLLLKPKNHYERIQFIFDNIDLYASFIQLEQLVEEQMKLYQKHLHMKK